jgi:hypothetical protein
MQLWENSRSKLSKLQVPRDRRRQWQQQLDQLRDEVADLRTSLVAVRVCVCVCVCDNCALCES